MHGMEGLGCRAPGSRGFSVSVLIGVEDTRSREKLVGAKTLDVISSHQS